MASSRLLASTLLFAGFVCAAQAATISATETLASLTPAQFNGIDFSKYIPKMNITEPEALPCHRPKPYKYPTRLKLSKYNSTESPTSDAVIWTLQHDPIKNVTADMVIWMWENLNKVVKDPRDGKSYGIYLLMHPTDHIGVEWDTKELFQSKLSEPANGTQWIWTEIPGSGCVAVDNTTINCPRKPFSGYTCDTNVAELNKRPTLNLTMYNAELRTKGPGPRVIRMRFFFNIKDTGIVSTDLWAPFVEFLHEMRQTRSGLMVTSQFTTGWDTSLAKVFNQPYMEPVWTAATGGNWQEACLYYALHTMQEWAVLPQWLPAVYKAEAGKH